MCRSAPFTRSITFARRPTNRIQMNANHRKLNSFGFTILNIRSTTKRPSAYAHSIVIEPVIQCPVPTINTAATLRGSINATGTANSSNDV